MSENKAWLILEDGMAFEGIPFGAEIPVSGEVVFNTGMVGYPESLTDPSYRGQILVLTYPLVGNYGIPSADVVNGVIQNLESDRIQVKGLVVAEHCAYPSHRKAQRSLAEWMEENGICGISGVDTREVTKRLRKHGTMLGKIVHGEDTEFVDPNTRNLVSEVSTQRPVLYGNGEKKVVLVDCGVKHGILRALLRRDLTVLRVPWNHPLHRMECDGVVISNGPGNPEMCRETIESVRYLLRKNIPVLGICLGMQILGLAAGARTYKMRYGHRGQNQPCMESGSGKCFITSQNHGYAVDSRTLPEDWRIWFYNLNDGTNEGIIHISKPFFGCQFHPEASPGPDDTAFIFDIFVRAME